MGALVTNNAWGELSVPITKESTQILLTGGQGERFPRLRRGSDCFYATLQDSKGNMEIVKCVERDADTLTVERGTDGTTAKSFPEGAKLECRLCAAAFNDKVSEDKLTRALEQWLAKAKKLSDDVQASVQELNGVIDESYATKAHVAKEVTAARDEAKEASLPRSIAERDYFLKAGGVINGEVEINSGSTGGLTVVGADIRVKSSKSGIGGGAQAEGQITAQSFRAKSDFRLKHDINPLGRGEALKLAHAVSPVRFRWNEDNQRDIGVIAQELRAVLPELVHEAPDGELTVNYNALGVIALAAVADLDEKLEELLWHQSQS